MPRYTATCQKCRRAFAEAGICCDSGCNSEGGHINGRCPKCCHGELLQNEQQLPEKWPRQVNIRTSFAYPPIPDRSMDWSAWIDGQEELATGHGESEAEAIMDLHETLEILRSNHG